MWPPYQLGTGGTHGPALVFAICEKVGEEALEETHQSHLSSTRPPHCYHRHKPLFIALTNCFPLNKGRKGEGGERKKTNLSIYGHCGTA